MDEKTTDSRSVGKIANQLRKLVDTDKFQSAVLAFRAALGIPSKGLEMTQRNRDHLGDPFYVPENSLWDKRSTRAKFIKQSNLFVSSLESNLAVKSHIFLNQVIKGYAYYGSLEFDEVAKQMPWSEKTALCEFKDWKLMLLERFWHGEVDPDLAPGFTEELIRGAEQYPLILRIHPDASQRDIISYIKENWNRIERAQSQYLVPKNNSVKNSKITLNEDNRKIVALVHLHPNSTLKEIKRLLKEQLGVTKTYEEVGKIRSTEKKRRQGK